MKTSRLSLIGISIAALFGVAACTKEADPLPPTPTPVVIQVPTPADPAPVATNLTALTAQLSGAGEVPPVITEASGTLEASLAPGSNVLTWTLNYTGLSGPLTGAHFHGPAMAGQNAGVAVPISGPLASPVSGSVTLNAAQVAEINAGNWYVNLHTAAHPEGEIRGQLQIRP
jgi:hypothetical protein